MGRFKTNTKFKTLLVGGALALGLLVAPMVAQADEVEGPQDVPVILNASGDGDFLRIAFVNTDALVFNDIDRYSNHNVWIDPQGGNIVDVVVDSSRAWTLAIEGDNFIGVDEYNLGEVVGLNRLRTRVQRAVLPTGQIIYTTSNTAGQGITGNNVGADGSFRNLTATGRQQKVVTNRVGRNFTYRMQFQFQGDREITEGEYRGAIRYVAWQR